MSFCFCIILLFTILFPLSQCFPVQTSLYSSIWVDANGSTNCSETLTGFSSDCACTSITEALSLVNDTFRVIEILSSNQPYIEQLIFTSNYGTNPIILRGASESMPVLMCPSRNATIIIENANVYIQNVQISGCNIRNKILKSLSQISSTGCSNFLATRENSSDEWIRMRDFIQTKAERLSSYIENIELIWEIQCSIENKTRMYHELLKQYHNIIYEKPNQSGHTNSSRLPTKYSIDSYFNLYSELYLPKYDHKPNGESTEYLPANPSEYSAIILEGGMLVLSNVIFFNNTGTLFISSPKELDAKNHVILDQIQFINNDLSIGYGMVILNSTINILDSNFFNNTAKTPMNIFGESNVKIANSNFVSNDVLKVGLVLNSKISTNNCHFEDNRSEHSVLEMIESSVTLHNSTFNNNTHLYGSGFGTVISLNSNLLVSNSTFIDNQNQYCSSSAISFHSKESENIQLSIIGSKFINNTSIDSNGGAVSVMGGSIEINSSYFEANSATNGGGIYICGKYQRIYSLNITDTTFFNNTAIWGGGAIFLEYCNTTIDVSSSNFSSNIAGREGGGIRYSSEYGRPADINNSYFYHNYASNGGGLLISGGKSHNLSNNSLQKNYANYGGALFLQSTTGFAHTYNLFEKNYAVEYGGGSYIVTSEFITLDYDNFTTNLSNVRDGGAVYFERSSGNLTNSLFHNNFAPFGDGAGILFSYFSNITIDNIVFSANVGRRGAAIASVADSSLNITNTVVKQQWTSMGAILMDGSTISVLNNVTIQENNSTSLAGGVALMGRSSTNITNCFISNNIADTSGGGLHMGGLITVFIANTTISYNKCSSSGGGMLITDMAKVQFTNTIVSNNYANSSGGGIIAASLAKPIFYNCTIENNSGHSSGGGAAMLDHSTANFTNCIIRNNHTPNVGGGMAFTDGAVGSLDSCIISSNTAGSDGGGIASTVATSLSISYCHIYSNTANSRGGGISISDFSSSFINSTIISHNVAISGAGIEAFDRGQYKIYNTLITKNNATTQGGAISASDQCVGFLSNILFDSNLSIKGGAVLLSQYAKMDIHDSIFRNNSANIGGGVLFSGVSGGEWKNCTFKSNYADYGGAYVTEEFASPVISDSTIEDNVAIVGGGMYLRDKSSPSILYTGFKNNMAHQNGGGVSVMGFSAPVMSYCSFEGNSAYKGGGLYFAQFVNGTFTNLLVHDNYATFGGAMFVYSSLSYFSNILVFNNECSENGGGIYVFIDQQSEFLNFENIFVSKNIAKEGGGIYVLSVNAVPQMSSSPNAHNPDKNSLSFTGLVLIENTAINGGGIFYMQYGSQNISFGPGCRINGNKATQYGAGVFLDVDTSNDNNFPTFLHETYFMNNYANIGGGSIATNSLIPFSSSICDTCFYVNNTGGYQTPTGYCSLPSEVTALAYPSTLTLNSQTFTISAVLLDAFSQKVVGPSFTNAYLVQLYVSDTSCILSFPPGSDSSVFIDSKSGLAVFSNLILQGKNNTVCSLIFNTTNTLPGYPSIPQSTIKIYLSGCNLTTDTIYTSTSNIDFCAPFKSFWTPENIFIALILILLILVFITLIWMIILVINLQRRKRKKPKQHFKEIPDFDERPKITLQEILNDPQIRVISWEHLRQEDRLGVGAGGVVYSGTWFIDGDKENIRKIAMKQVLLGRPENLTADLMHQFLIEIKLMSALKHKHIVEFIGVSSPFSNELYLITELMSRGSVDNVIEQKRDNLPASLRMKFLIDAAKGVVYMHERNVIHRDLKPSNFLVNEDWTCKVADLGVSTIKPALTKTMTVIGTPIYMAPEIILNRKYSESCDVYSFGIMIGEIFLGKKPYSSQESSELLQAQLLYKICNEGLRPSTTGLPSSLKQLVIECWNQSPKQRPSMAEVLNRLQRLKSELSRDHKKYKKKLKKSAEAESLLTPGESTIN